MTRTTPSRSLRLVTGLLATAGVVVAATAAAAPTSADTLSDTDIGGLAPSITSSNVQKIAGLPETTAISMEFARTGPYAYVSSLDTISVLDLTDPRDPQVRGTLTQAMFENEAMTYGERVKGGELTRFVIAAIDLYRVSTDDPDHVNADDGPQIAIIDVTDPDRPFTRGVTDVGEVTSSTHTVQCVDQADCRYAYTAGNGGEFSILDLGDLDDPTQIAEVRSPAAGPNPVFKRGAGHYWDFDGALGWHTGSGGAAAFDVSDPAAPVLVNATDGNGTAPGWNDFILHNSMRPNASAFTAGAEPSTANGNVLLVTEEDYLHSGEELACDKAGSFQTWYVPDLDGEAYRLKNPTGSTVGVGTVTPLDATNAPAEFGVGGVSLPASTICSAHWFDVHQDGFVAQGWYGAGLQILDVRDPRNIAQLGYASGLATEVWDAYWVPVRNSAGKAIPGKKTNLLYTADAVRGVEVFEVTLPSRN